jgi:hypothetical protein
MTTPLLTEARGWVQAVHPHAPHLLHTETWLLELDGDAGEGLRLAAVLHDIERAFPDADATWDSARDWDSPEYNRWHQDRCARIASDWLRAQGAPDALVAEVDALIRVHEEGGWREADLLQAADSLSFLETMVPLVVGWVETGRAPRERAAGKVRNSVERMAPGMDRARDLAAPYLDEALLAVGRAREGAER